MLYQERIVRHITLRNALFIAIENARLDFIHQLVEYGADINWKCTRSGTTLHIASTCGHVAVVEFLLNKGLNNKEHPRIRWESALGLLTKLNSEPDKVNSVFARLSWQGRVSQNERRATIKLLVKRFR